MVRDFRGVQGALAQTRHGFHHALRLAVDSAPEGFADVVVEADGELGFFRVGFAVGCGLRGFGHLRGLAVGDEGAVGGDVGDGVVDYGGGVLECSRGGESLFFAGEWVWEEGSSVVGLREGGRCSW